MLVALQIKKGLYKDYLNFLCEFDKITKVYNVSRDNDFGKLLCSRVKYSALPVKSCKDEHTVFLQLPKSRPLASAKNHYLFYSKEDQAKITDGLEVMFNNDFDRYYLQGMKLRMMQKDIIQSFIISRKLTGLIGDNEMLKKRQYREELEIIKIYTNKLLEKAKYSNSLVLDALKTPIYL